MRGYLRRLTDRLRQVVPRSDVWLDEEERLLTPPRRLWVNPDDPTNHYLRWQWEFFAYLTLLARVERTSSVLELGCGHGRTARGLLAYLRSPGTYVGLDVNRLRIEDAQGRISSRWPNFQFHWADVQNADDNPAGRAVGSYRFPVADESCDVVYAASLFTHLLPDEAARYLTETRRVLRPAGRCLFSVFVLDHYRGPGTTISPFYEFDARFGSETGVAVRDPARPHEVIAYSLERLRELIEASRLRIDQVVPGLWSESPGWAVNEQDLLVLVRA
jgi:SAM-dependent methyltransferase